MSHAYDAISSLMAKSGPDKSSRMVWYADSAASVPFVTACANNCASLSASVMPCAVIGSLKYPASPTSAHPCPHAGRNIPG